MSRRLILACVLLLAACSQEAPEPRVVVEAKPAGTWTAGAMVAAANPLAVAAGLEILEAGGSAVDAAIAVQAVLGLVEPQSSGIGGGAFMLYYDAKTGDVTAYDGRETAPAGARADMFLIDGAPEPFGDAVRSGRSVGTPGLIAMLALAHADHGALDMGAAFGPAVRLAEEGFPVSERLSGMIALASSFGPLGPDAAAYLTTDGVTPLPPGHILKNPDYAATLTEMGRRGPRVFYEGRIAEAIVEAVQRGNAPGTLSPDDLKTYEARRLEPLCRSYRKRLVCGMGPPSSGGMAVLMALGMLERFDMKAAGDRPAGWHLLIEAERLAYADRDQYAADDRFVKVPVKGLLDPGYLKGRARLISPAAAMEKAEAGRPPGAPKRAADAAGGWTGTSHFVVVDGAGNVVSMTTTVESVFGSQRMAAGFFLNNQLTDFSFAPADENGLAIANAAAPGKKPRSSMAPTIVFDQNGRFLLAVGSPGGNAIIGYVLKTLVAVLDWEMEPAAAIGLPNVVARGRTLVEAGFDADLRAALTAMGHRIEDMRTGEASGLHAVMLTPDGRLTGAADPRREGEARGL